MQEFDADRVYYAGDEVAGLPLEDASGDHPRSSAVVFIYGDCDPPTTEGGCAPPVQIQNFSTCKRWASLLHDKSDIFDFRGAKAAGGRIALGGSLEIFTGRTTVTIYAESDTAKSVAQELRSTRQERPSRLPPPLPGSLWGKLPCQDKPGY